MTQATSPDAFGKVVQVMGPVVDISFQGQRLPEINTALRLTNPSINDQQWNLVLEVAQHLGEIHRAHHRHGRHRRPRARRRGPRHGQAHLHARRQGSARVASSTSSASPSTSSAPHTPPRSPIHRLPRRSSSSRPRSQAFETGIKVIDLLAPYARGGKIGLFGGAGVGKTVLHPRTHQQRRHAKKAASPCSPASVSAPAKATTSTTR
jgi:F-type H+-transporting ATPase subunit beta